LGHSTGPDSHIIIELFKQAERGTFSCQHCKREAEYRFNPVFLAYDTNRTNCPECDVKIEQAIKEQKIVDKEKALDKWKAGIDMIADNMIELAGVPVIFQSASIKDLEHATSKALSPYKSYFIKGNVGVGKSHMAVALMREYIKAIPSGYDERKKEYCLDDADIFQPIFIEVPELLLRIRDTYSDSNNESEKDIVELFSKTPFLVLDDLGSEKASEFSTLMIYLIINRRSTSGKTTIITSNLDLGQIRDRLSDRISSRIKGMCREINVTGDDKRYESKGGGRGVIDTIQDMT
jgi:DNA replication protein DnaC